MIEDFRVQLQRWKLFGALDSKKHVRNSLSNRPSQISHAERPHSSRERPAWSSGRRWRRT